MRVLVTGGAGFIGGAVCRRLLQSGHAVVVLDNLTSGDRGRGNARQLEVAGVRVVEGDIRDPEKLRDTMRECERAVHLAAMASVAASVQNPDECWAINAAGTQLVLDEARRAGLDRVVFASTAAVYGMEPRLPSSEDHPLAPLSPYAEAKIAGEVACRDYQRKGDLETAVLRFFNVYGAGQDPRSSYSGVITRWVEALRDREAVDCYGDGLQTRDFVHVEDVAAGVVSALECAKTSDQPMNIGSGRSTSLRDLLEELGRVFEIQPLVRFLPARAGDVLHSRADIRRATEFLNYAPSVPLSKGLRNLVTSLQ